MKNPFHRRRFIQQLMALTGAHLIGGCGSGTGGTGGAGGTGHGGGGTGGSGGSGKRVVVVGGGLAGMCSAYELRKKGYEIAAVLEAQDRVGGRVLTLRDGFKNNQYAEAGATRIADSHNFTLAYAQEFNLTLREFITSEPALYYLKGKTPFIHADGDPWPTDVFSFPTAEQQMMKGADSIIFDYEKLDELGDPLASDWPTGKALDYNELGIEDYLKANGANDDVVLLDRAINGTELKRDGALYWLMADVVDAKWDKTYAIQGGNDQLPKAFATALGDLIKLKCQVTAIAQTDNGVTVTYKDGTGTEQQISGDLCVVAIPYTLLRKVKITPELSAAKKNVVDNVSMMPVGRCYLQTKSRFWNKNGIGGLKVARTDTYVERLWDVTKVQDGDTGILLSYMMGDNGEAFGAQSDDKKIDYVKSGVKAFFPEIETEFDNGQFKVWQDDPWVGGGWAYYKPGQMKDMFPAAKKSEGRLFFCGEHTSAWSGWMQGALESANRVVTEISTG
ncbi:MAG: FAD-dependent oxidoreductase [Minicystis sp.]